MSCTSRPSFFSPKLAIRLALMTLSLPCASSAATFEIEPQFYGTESADISIVVDGHEQCRILREAGDDNVAKSAACRFSVSTPPSSIVVIGKYGSQDSEGGPRSTRKVKTTFDLMDFEPAASKLTTPGKPFGPRVADFIQAAKQFASQHNLQSFDLEGSKPASHADIEKAQKRLGYALPSELASLLTTIGAIHEGDNAMTSVESIADSYTTMQRDWETEEVDLIDSYSPGMLELLKSSTLLYTEVGDGFGGLLYRPPPTKACGDKGLYLWTTQEGGTESLSKNGACPDFARVFRWLLNRFVIEQLAEEMQETTGSVLIDTSTVVQHLQLSAEDYQEFRLVLKTAWQQPIVRGE